MRIVACSDPHSRRLGMRNVVDVDKIRGHIHSRTPVECMFGGKGEGGRRRSGGKKRGGTVVYEPSALIRRCCSWAVVVIKWSSRLNNPHVFCRVPYGCTAGVSGLRRRDGG
jgi:hypothetical protein